MSDPINYKTQRDENGRLPFAAIHGATEGFTSITLITLKALRDKIAETTCKEDTLILVNQFITDYAKAQESFLGRTFTKRKDSTSDNAKLITLYEEWVKAPTPKAKGKVIANSGVSRAVFYKFARDYSSKNTQSATAGSNAINGTDSCKDR